MTILNAGRLILLLPSEAKNRMNEADSRDGEAKSRPEQAWSRTGDVESRPAGRPTEGGGEPDSPQVSPISSFDLGESAVWIKDLARTTEDIRSLPGCSARSADLAGLTYNADHIGQEAIEALPDWEHNPPGLRGKVVLHGLPADIFLCAECGSTFDLAWLLAAHGLLNEWDAVISMRQSAGRGQLRRHWHSPPGNLYVSFRLPDRFLGLEAASVLTAFLLINAFGNLGLELKLKWPNDLVLYAQDGSVEKSGSGKQGGPGKLGGVLLEERSEKLVAGVGINCTHLPDSGQLRKDAAMPAAVLPANFPCRNALPLWSRLVHNLILIYEKTFRTTSARELLQQSEKCLLWKGSEVQVQDHYEEGSAITGILSGLTELGGLRILVSGASNRKFPGAPGSTGLPDPQDSSARPCSTVPRGTNNPFGLEEISIYSGSVKSTG